MKTDKKSNLNYHFMPITITVKYIYPNENLVSGNF